MQLQRKRLLILGVILAISLTALLIFLFSQKMDPTSPHHLGEIVQTDALTLSCDELSALLRHELSDYLPVDSFDITLSPSGTVALNATLKKSDAIHFLEKQHSSLRYAAAFLRDPIDAHLILRISQTETGPWIEPTDFRISNFELTSLLTPELTQAINAAISHYCDEKEIKIISFRVLSDAISINIKHHLT